jgi:hypothetical protein
MDYNNNFLPYNRIGCGDPDADYIDDDNVLFFDIDSNTNQEIAFDIILSQSDIVFTLDYMYKVHNEITYREDYLECRF